MKRIILLIVFLCLCAVTSAQAAKVIAPAPSGQGTYAELDGSGTSIIYVSPDSGDNSHTQINTAIDKVCGATDGGIVRLTEGTFWVSGNIVPKSNCTIEGVGPGTIIKPVADSVTVTRNIIDCENVENVTIRNLSYDGNLINRSAASGEGNVDFLFENVDGLKVENVHMTGTNIAAIDFVDVTDGIIKNCTFKWGVSDFVAVGASSNVKVLNNFFYYTGYREDLPFDGGSVAFVADEILTGGTNGGKRTVVSVTVTSGAWGDSDAAGYITVSLPQGRPFIDDEVLTGSISGAAVMDGIENYGISNRFAIEVEDGSTGVLLDGNSIDTCTTGGVNVQAHAGTDPASDLIISRNTIKNYSVGINIDSRAHTNLLIQDNIFTELSDYDGYGGPDGIYTSTTGTNIAIRENAFSPKYGKAITFTSSSDTKQLTIDGNVIAYPDGLTYNNTGASIGGDHENFGFNDNTLTDSYYIGLSFGSSASITTGNVSGNIISGVMKSTGTGIYWHNESNSDTNCVLANNSILATRIIRNVDGGAGSYTNVSGAPAGWIDGRLTENTNLDTITSDTLLTVDHATVIINASSNAVTATLPVIPVLRKKYTIKSIDSANTVTVDGNGFNIDGSATITLATNISTTIQFDGSEWRVL